MAKMFLILLCMMLISAATYTAETNYEVSVTTVTVWMKALDKSGKPVQGLTQKDFEVKEDGHSVTPSSFEEITEPTISTPTQTSENTQTASSSESDSKFVI